MAWRIIPPVPFLPGQNLTSSPLWASAFRPFYFLGALYAPLLVAAWLARVSILIEYEAAPTQVEEAVEEMVADVQAAVA